MKAIFRDISCKTIDRNCTLLCAVSGSFPLITLCSAWLALALALLMWLAVLSGGVHVSDDAERRNATKRQQKRCMWFGLYDSALQHIFDDSCCFI